MDRSRKPGHFVGRVYKTITFWFLAALFLCLGFLFFSTTSRSSAARKPVSPVVVDESIMKAIELRQQDKKNKCPHCGPTGDQAIYIPLVDLREAKESEIVFNSRSPKVMEVSPTFYKADGTPVPAEKVQIQSQEIRYVKIKDLLPKYARGVRDWGGMTLSYYGTNREMWAQLRFLKVNGGGSVDEFFTVVSESRSALYEAAWWAPKDSASIVALGNVTDQATSVNVKFGDQLGQVVSLAPHATAIVRQEARAVDGPADVRLEVIGAPGSVIPTGIISSPHGAFNSVIRFYSPALAKQSHLYANGFRVGNIESHMVLRNTSSEAVVAHPKLLALGGGASETIVLPEVSLSPNQTTEVDLSQLSASARKRSDLNVATVEVTNSGAAGSLIGSLYGINRETGVNYETPLRDSGPVRSMTGAYPWKVSDDYSTVVYITNISDREAGFIAQLNYGVDHFVFDPRTLQPGETAVFNLAQIRDEQVPDNQGRRLPKETSLGQFKWAVRGVTGGELVLIGRAEMVSKAEQISTSYSCNDPCPPTYGGSIDPFLPPIVIVGSKITSIWETAYYGSGVQSGPYSVSADWSVSNIASCSPTSAHTVQVCGNTAGNGFITAFVRYEESYGYDGRDCYDNNNQYAVADGNILDVFDLNLEFSPSEIQPSGTGGTSQTTVTLHTTPHAVGVPVSMSVQAQGDGGHVQHSGTRPLGTFTNASGNTDASGNYSTTFNASAFGGSVNIRATVQGQTATNQVLEVRVANLGVIASTSDWNLVGQTGTHPDNHYGTATLNVGIGVSARDYTDVYYGVGNHAPDADRLKFNDMSLVNGGKFEIAGNWNTGVPHDEHRLGQNCDIFSGNVPTNRWSTLTGIFVNRGSPNYVDETASANHWHVRFPGP